MASATAAAAGADGAAFGGTADGFLESEKAHLRFVKSNDGKHDLCIYFWPAQGKAKGVLQVTHGHGCYIAHSFLVVPTPGAPPVYEGSWVEVLNKEGWAVFGVDNRGAGRSSGLRAYCDKFDDYVEDALLAARMSKEVDVPGFKGVVHSLPLFVMGHSLGGCIALMMAIRTKGQGLFKGVALMAPMLSLEKVANKGINRYLRPLAAIANVLVPTASLVQTEKNTMYPAIQEVFDKDPLNRVANTRVRNANEYLRITAWLMANMDKEVTFPFIVFHSLNDTMCDINGSKALFDKSPSTDKRFEHVDNMWHIVVKEPGNRDVLKTIIAWLEERRG